MLEEVKKQFNRRGLIEAIYRAYVPGKNDYETEVAELQAANVAVGVLAGITPEIGLMAREAHDRSYPVQLVAGLNLATEDFGLTAEAPRPRERSFLNLLTRAGASGAVPFIERFRAAGDKPEGDTLYAYAAVQVWARRLRRPARWNFRR